VGTSPKRAKRQKTILLVDDDPIVVKSLREVLRRKGYEVFAAETLDDAITAVKTVLDIDLLIVDAVMPQMSGPELAEILVFMRPKMKILFITGLDGFTIRLAFNGQCDCLQKPFSMTVLLSKVHDLLKEVVEAEP